ncbi:restriction endonuclease subunit S [Lebetimonas sp. JH292]|uniref:restriction endonuclease subunit S n=1 Tax=Lebetimonas sp. JH292 TaxID=990068 RepID=UPI0035100356
MSIFCITLHILNLNLINKEKGLRGGVSVNSFKNIKIALPPLAEQKAIVEKWKKRY